jgi:N6-adenosine-specific RNA methylase IME4
MSAALPAKYEAARRALAEAYSVDEVKEIRDKAVALQTYATQAKDGELIRHATEIRMRAERKAGELLIQMAERGERQKPGDDPRGVNSRTAQPLKPRLADLGVTKTQSSRWQELARIPEDKFKAKVESASKTAYDRMTGRVLKEVEIARRQKERAKRIEYGCTVADLETLMAAGKRFPVIYADPPWLFEVYSGAGKARSAENHYETQSLESIAALPVVPLAADDAVLLMWCPWPHITAGDHLKIVRAWGFEPSTIAFVWIKTTPSATIITLDGEGLYWGMGYGTRANSEVCLIATRGSPLRLAADVHQVVFAPVGEHSEKPEEVRRRVERLFDGPYLELYGRKPVDGWTVWGNEINRADFPQYDAQGDITKSVQEGFAAINARKAGGGDGWRGHDENAPAAEAPSLAPHDSGPITQFLDRARGDGSGQ